MGKILIVNGSPRASRSNSKKYAELFVQYWEGEAEYYLAVSKKHQTIYRFLAEYDALLFVFPLYADGIPAIILDLHAFEKECFSQFLYADTLTDNSFRKPRQILNDL